ncbi:hypothetical protein [Pectobacterium cacticida]|uniref:hypothetical protein n=1 Tax=Pectobacterium cacticida TaxID=69221 RepID=UPI002FEFD345
MTQARQFWRAFTYIMHLHENRPIKRAGVAGVALRARAFERGSPRAAAPRCEVFRVDAASEVGFSQKRVEHDWSGLQGM